MKRSLLLSLILLCVISFGYTQQSTTSCIPLIGDQAPAFKGKTTTGPINFPDDYFAKWKILFSHPADFTAVCSTEIMELARMQKDFKKLNTAIFVLSTDGLNSHIQWVKSLEGIDCADGNIPKIEFPIISDVDMSISKKYGMLDKDTTNPKNVRAVFIIDDNNKVKAIFYYPSQVGRNMDEIKRTLIALQTTDSEGILTPVNWNPGEDYMVPSPTTIEESKEFEKKKSDRFYNKTWYMWFKKQ